ncbi:MAG: hypothetical protein HYT27_00595 [Parcubacteria group bacterium]|nr:hypothetical protein [Parcubacteria group bacterium]
MANIYMICSVRNATEEEKAKVLEYVEALEKDGHTVKCPFRDTKQDDETGMRIVEEHEGDIIWADEIHIIWNPDSQGSLWDAAQTRMAMHFMPEKKIVVGNVLEIEITNHKSYINAILMTHYGLDSKSSLDDLKKAQAVDRDTDL